MTVASPTAVPPVDPNQSAYLAWLQHMGLPAPAPMAPLPSAAPPEAPAAAAGPQLGGLLGLPGGLLGVAGNALGLDPTAMAAGGGVGALLMKLLGR